MHSVAIVVPVRNEASSIRPLFESFARVLPDFDRKCSIILVDGFSTDGTPDVVRHYSDGLPVELVELPENRGLGGALDTGLQRALDIADIIVTMDGDNSHDPGLIPALLDRIDEGYDCVIASRFHPGGQEVGVRLHRRALSHGASRLLRILAPYDSVTDYSSGFRGYRSSALRGIRRPDGRLVTEEGFSCMLELLLRLRADGARASEIALVLRYDRKKSDSKMAVGRTALRYVRLVLANGRRDGGPTGHGPRG